MHPWNLSLRATAWCPLLAAVLAGCQSQKHTVAPADADRVTVCATCYDEIVKARGSGGPRGGLATNRLVTKHACDDCQSEMSIYTEQGVLMVKCSRCAPEGLPCDRCAPPAAQAVSD